MITKLEIKIVGIYLHDAITDQDLCCPMSFNAPTDGSMCCFLGCAWLKICSPFEVKTSQYQEVYCHNQSIGLIKAPKAGDDELRAELKETEK